MTSSVYFYGYKTGYKELSEDRLNDISKYEKEINLIKIENKNKMDFFSKKLITISAQMETINALGNKIAKIAKIDKKDFNFTRPKYIGGKNKVSIEFEYDSNFDLYLNDILFELSKKEDELNYTNEIINNLTNQIEHQQI